jgi:hypothetical protein
MLWRWWGRRIYTVPVTLAFVLLVTDGPWVASGMLTLVAALFAAARRWGDVDGLLAYEEAHAVRCRIRGTWHRVTRGAKLARDDLFPSLSRRMPIRHGSIEFRVKPAPGHHQETWENAARGLAKAWHVADVEVTDRFSRRGGGSGWLDVRVSTLGVPQRTIPWPYEPGAAAWGLDALPVGQAGGSRVAAVSLLDPPHMLVAGPTGGGKSSFLNALLCGIAPRDDAAVVMIDLKGVDFARWRPRLSVLVHDPDEVRATLAWLVAVMEDRFRILRRDGQELWRPSPDGPQLVCVIDEFAELAPALHPAVDKLVRKGRAAGISVVVCTQRPVSTLGPAFTNIRSQLGTRVALGPLSRAEAQLVLGDGNVPPVWPRYPPGVARIQAAHAGRTIRVFWCRDVIGPVVDVCADRRPEVPAGLRLT